MTDANCPTCGAPCKATIQSRGGEWGWGTTDEERTTYAYSDFTTEKALVPLMSPEEINALPEKVRNYIHQLETNADPAGMVRENMQLRDTNESLQNMYRKAADALAAAAPMSAPPSAAVALAEVWRQSAEDCEGSQGGVSADYHKGLADGMRQCAEDLLAAPAPTTEQAAPPIARLLHWKGPAHMPVPHGGIAARTFAEFSREEAEKVGSYWKNGADLHVTTPGGEAPAEDRFANDDLARALYEGWDWEPGWVPWVEKGNSDRQNEARRLAAQIRSK